MKTEKSKKQKIRQNKIISFRVTEFEYLQIIELLNKFGLNKTDAMRKIVNTTINNELITNF